ncbi:MAG: hypothetical protein ACM37W_23055 [Actinomycetota bacterium]
MLEGLRAIVAFGREMLRCCKSAPVCSINQRELVRRDYLHKYFLSYKTHNRMGIGGESGLH